MSEKNTNSKVIVELVLIDEVFRFTHAPNRTLELREGGKIASSFCSI